VLLTVLSRMGANSKVVLTHDVAQRDNLRVGRHDGVVAVVDRLKGHPLFAVGGQELGYLPGSESEKMSPWAQAVFDTLGALTSSDVIDEVLDRGMLEVLPLTHIRGR
jgi:predicted ribonuclease YlaK